METAKFSFDIQGIREYSGSFYVYKKASVPRDQLRKKMRAQYDSILRFLNTNNIPTNGSPMTVYEAFSVDKDTVVFHHGITVRERVVIENDSTIFCDFVDNQNVLKATLKGNYSNLQKAWAQALMYLEVNEIKPSGKMPFEIYANDPSALPNPAEWITEIYVPIK
jgi:effector-binding domain-containing protein